MCYRCLGPSCLPVRKSEFIIRLAAVQLRESTATTADTTALRRYRIVQLDKATVIFDYKLRCDGRCQAVIHHGKFTVYETLERHSIRSLNSLLPIVHTTMLDTAQRQQIVDVARC